MAKFITPVDITPTTAGAWVDVNVSSYVSASATGVILHVHNTDTVQRAANVRKNGSTDAHESRLQPGNHTWWSIGVDANKIFEAYIAATTVKIYLVGYYEEEANFFTNSIAKTPATTNSWVDVSIANETGSDTAIGAIFNFISTAYSGFGIRKKGSTDDRRQVTAEDVNNIYPVIGLDNTETCQAYISTTISTYLFLQGYLTDKAYFYTNALDYSLSTTNAWVDLTALPSGIGAIIEVYNGQYTSYNYGLRKNGSSENIVGKESFHSWAIVECDAQQIIEGYIDNLSTDFFLIGYLKGVQILEVTGSLSFTLTPTYEVKFVKKVSTQVYLNFTPNSSLTKTNLIAGALSLNFSLSSEKNFLISYFGQLSTALELSSASSLSKQYLGSLSLTFSPSSTYTFEVSFVVIGQLTLALTASSAITKAATPSVRLSLAVEPQSSTNFVIQKEGQLLCSFNLTSQYTLGHIYVYQGALSQTFNLSSSITKTSVHSGWLHLTLTTSYLLQKVRSIEGQAFLEFSPSSLLSITRALEKLITFYLTPSHSKTITQTLVGELTALLSLQSSLATTKVYSAQSYLSLNTSSELQLTKNYLGEILISLSPSSEYILGQEFIVFGSLEVSFYLASPLNKSSNYSVLTQIILTPQTVKAYSRALEGATELSLSLASTKSFAAIKASFLILNLLSQSFYSYAKELESLNSVVFTLSCTQSASRAASGQINLYFLCYSEVEFVKPSEYLGTLSFQLLLNSSYYKKESLVYAGSVLVILSLMSTSLFYRKTLEGVAVFESRKKLVFKPKKSKLFHSRKNLVFKKV